MAISEIVDELLRLESPHLRPDYDPDIERYYDLRTAGKTGDAMVVYSRLKARYPDDEFRSWLLRCYRSKHPAFKALLARGYRALGERSLERVKKAINYIANKVESYNPRDAYATIRAAEAIVLILPKERYEALAGIDRFHRYAAALDFRARSMGKAAELVRAFLTNSLTIVQEERRRNGQRQEQARQRQRTVQADWDGSLMQDNTADLAAGQIDLSAVTFSAADLSRIEIPKIIDRIEDQTIAYCVKYWNLIEDTGFERLLLLYSRKYNSKNHAIYLAIRRGRQGQKRDDEILTVVMSFLVRGYYYSVLGDHYLQQRWNAIKSSLLSITVPVIAAHPTAPVKPPTVVSPRPTAVPARPQKPVPVPVTVRQPVPTPAPILQPVPVKMPMKKAGGSVSDRLRELSGRSYDVYQDRFLANARIAIRKVLGAGRGIFFTLPEAAEVLLYTFLKAHYADPYMNWAESEERKTFEKMGFELDSLIPIIDECYKRL